MLGADDFIYYGQKCFLRTEKIVFSIAGSFFSPMVGLGIHGVYVYAWFAWKREREKKTEETERYFMSRGCVAALLTLLNSLKSLHPGRLTWTLKTTGW